MRMMDVNVLVYAYREDAPNHKRYRNWLEDVVAGPEAFALSELVLSGFLRVVTHPKVFQPPSPVAHAMEFLDVLRGAANAVLVHPGPRHWDIFAGLCRKSGCKGNTVPDAYFAALAIESGSEWVTADRGFARFAKLRWGHPFDL